MQANIRSLGDLLKACGITRRALAEQAEVSTPLIQNVLRGYKAEEPVMERIRVAVETLIGTPIGQEDLEKLIAGTHGIGNGE